MINKRYNRSVSGLAQRNNKLKKIKLSIFAIILVVFVGSFFYVARLPSLQVSSVQVVGEKSIPKDYIENAALESISGNRLLLLPKSNVFLLSESSVASVLYSEFPRIEKVNVVKNANGILKIEVKEREAVALWCREDSCFLMDSTGLIYSPSVDLESFGKIVFKGAVSGEPLMQHFQDTERIKSYLSAVSLLKSNDVDVSTIEIESTDKAVVSTNIGNILVDPNEKNLESALENALLVIDDIKSKDPNKKFDYIDTRFGNKVFYK